jgi:signal transduction histidine kinase
VTVSRDGDLRGLPVAVSQAAYRVVQEALTNVTRHARPCRVEVSLRRTSDALDVAVDDDGRRPVADAGSPGYGLVGMRERVTAAGGRLSAGPGPDGGWQVRAAFPLTGRETA